MLKLLSFLALAVLLATCAASFAVADPESPVTWLEDAATQSRVSVSEASVAAGADAIRSQAAVFATSSLERAFVPIEIVEATIDGLPAYVMRGVFLHEDKVYAACTAIVYGATRTFLIWSQGEAEMTLERLNELVELADRPNPAGAETVRELVTRTRPALPKLKELAFNRNRAAFLRIQEEDRKRDGAIEIARRARGDLASELTNAEELNRRLREAPPDRVYGWGAEELGGDEYSVTFIVETGDQRTMLVWITNTASGACANVTADGPRVENLRSRKKLNLPSDARLLAYEASYDMTTFKSSDYYRGRGTDPLGRTLP